MEMKLRKVSCEVRWAEGKYGSLKMGRELDLVEGGGFKYSGTWDIASGLCFQTEIKLQPAEKVAVLESQVRIWAGSRQ